MYDLTGFQRDMLYIIAGLDEPHGLVIKDELEDYYEQEVVPAVPSVFDCPWRGRR